MRFKASPFTHPDYSAVLAKSQMWASVWGMGHVFMVVFFAIAMAVPFGVAMIWIIAPDLIQGRKWDFAASCTSASFLTSAIGFAVRSYAKKKGSILAKL